MCVDVYTYVYRYMHICIYIYVCVCVCVCVINSEILTTYRKNSLSKYLILLCGLFYEGNQGPDRKHSSTF